MRHCRIVTLALALPWSCVGQVQMREEHSSVVHIETWGPDGRKIERAWVVLTALGGSEAYKGSGVQIAVRAPTGLYTLQVDSPGFEGRRELLRVYEPDVFRTVILNVARLDSQDAGRLAGVVHNYDGDPRVLRMRLVSLYGNELRESRLDAHNSFSFPVDQGYYMLLTVADLVGGPRVLDTKSIRITAKEAVAIDLKHNGGNFR